MMQTRCPRCQTLFRVTPEQLKARQGRVRCGHCQSVFNALEALEEEQLAAIVEAAPALAGAPEAPAQPLPEIVPGPTPEAAEPVEPATRRVAEPEEPPPQPEAEPEPEPAPEPEPETPAEEPAADSLGLEPLLHEAEAPRRAWPWVVGILLALLVLGLQAILQLRVELAVLYPAAKPALQALCGVAGCDVPLPQKIDLIGIETSDLHPDPAGDGRLQLVANLRNRAPFVQPYPYLEVTLTDVSDQALVRRVFTPAEYLPADANKAGFAAKGEQAVSLVLDAPGVAAVGYRLYVFYP